MNDQAVPWTRPPTPSRGFILVLFSYMMENYPETPITAHTVAIELGCTLEKARSGLNGGVAAGYFQAQKFEDQRKFRISTRQEFDDRQVERETKRVAAEYVRNQRPVWKKFWDWIRS